MHYTNRSIQIIASLIILASSWSCRKSDKVNSSPSLMLSFSADTVMFDTVLTTVGSVTKRLLVYNHNKNKVVVSQIRLGGGSASMYRINVDGQAAYNIQNVEIEGNDSLYIFVKVTVNPNNKSTPFIVSDSIVFMTNTNRQMVQLAALGQNADFNIGKTLKGNQIWDSLKAHVIYGFLRIDTGASLTILPGTKVYLHKGGYLAVSDQASLTVSGQWEHPVRIQGDRLDTYYRDLPGQWQGIYLERGSLNNFLSYAVIKNGNYGLIIDSLITGSGYKLTMEGTIIQNMVYDGIYAYSTSVQSENCIIGNCGGAALRIEKGGNYDFKQLTVGNYWSSSVRNTASLILSNYSTDTSGRQIPYGLAANFGNIILYGTETDELELDSTGLAGFSYLFNHALLKTSLKVGNANHYQECLVNKDPLFLNVQTYDYEIDSMSPAIGQGVPMGVSNDIRGILRPTSPALGAYEYYKKP